MVILGGGAVSYEQGAPVQLCKRAPPLLQCRFARQVRSCLAESAYKVVLQKSIPAQIRQLILQISNDRGLVDGFVRELTSAKRP
jgi:hypothetical protein